MLPVSSPSSDPSGGTATAVRPVEAVEVDHLAVALRGVTVEAGGRTVLGPLDLDLLEGGVTALAGGSGAGKSTLLATLAGLRPVTSGRVRRPLGRRAPFGGGTVGFVPQDDIIHEELPLRRTLEHSARLRLPWATEPEIDRAVSDVIATLGLGHREDVRVASLSGGQRKRASIAVELLARPDLLLLDEPTSGLDPVSAAEVLLALRRLADRGITVVMTTHDPAQIERCDRVVFLTSLGRVAFAGRPDGALDYFEVEQFAEIYLRLAHESSPDEWARRFDAHAGPLPALDAEPGIDRRSEDAEVDVAEAPGARCARWLGQVLTLGRRSAEVMVHSRLTLAVMVGSPVLVITMMAVLFPPGAADGTGVQPAAVLFWVAFAGFFFGLTYGLLQVVGERAVFERERFAGLAPSAYLTSKVLVLLPVLAAVAGALLVVLVVLDRLPAADGRTYAVAFASLVLESLAALLLGLAASAAVRDAAQATLALPMLCFPQVLFAGAVVAVAEMTPPGRSMSVVLVTRWAFDALVQVLGPASADQVSWPVEAWSLMAVLGLASGVAAWVFLRRP